MSDYLGENTMDKLYIWLSDTINGKKYTVEVKNNFYFSENGLDRGVIQSKTKMTRRENFFQRK